MKKITLTFLAVIVKMLGSMVLGLVVTNDFASYTSYLSRTNDINFFFLLFILLIDVLTIFILTHITNVFFDVSLKIKNYITFSILALLVFWVSDVIFILEIKSHNLIHHVFTGMILFNKYIVFLLISIAYTLEMHKIHVKDKEKTFLNYENFRYKVLINKKLFSYSKFLYNNGIALSIYITLMIYINFLSLYLYSNTFLFFLNILFCALVLFYLLVIAYHQLTTILNIYKTQTSTLYSDGSAQPICA